MFNIQKRRRRKLAKLFGCSEEVFKNCIVLRIDGKLVPFSIDSGNYSLEQSLNREIVGSQIRAEFLAKEDAKHKKHI